MAEFPLVTHSLSAKVNHICFATVGCPD